MAASAGRVEHHPSAYFEWGGLARYCQEAKQTEFFRALEDSKTHYLRIQIKNLIHGQHYPQARLFGGFPRRTQAVYINRQQHLLEHGTNDRHLVNLLAKQSLTTPPLNCMDRSVDLDFHLPSEAEVTQVLETLYRVFNDSEMYAVKHWALCKTEYSGFAVTRAHITNTDKFLGLTVHVKVDLVCTAPVGLFLDFDVNALTLDRNNSPRVHEPFLRFLQSPRIIVKDEPVDVQSLPSQQLRHDVQNLAATVSILRAISSKEATLIFESVESVLERPGLQQTLQMLKQHPHYRFIMSFDVELCSKFAAYYESYVWFLFFRRVPKVHKDFTLRGIDSDLVDAILLHQGKYAGVGYVTAYYQTGDSTITFHFYESTVQDRYFYNTSQFVFRCARNGGS